MADSKISALPASTTPLAGTEVLPIVQSGATVKVANNDLRPKQIQSNATSGVLQVAGPASAATRVMTTPDANFTAARTDAAQSFTGDQTFATGNLIIGTSGKGIDFSATAGTGTSELLADYEEGTWDPGITFGGAAVGVTFAGYQGGFYTKIGNRVFFTAQMRLTSKGTSVGTASITGLPFVSAGGNPGISSVSFFVDSLVYVNGVGGQVDLNSATMSIYSMISGGGATALTNVEFANSTNVKMMGHYYT